MNGFEAIIENTAREASRGAKPNEKDFYKDGLLHCGKCGRVKETLLEFPVGSGRMKKFPCVCDCNEAADKAENERMKREARERRIKDLQRQGLTEARYYSCTFANDDGHNPSISAACKRYVDKWQDMKEKNIGILFYGNVGTGKSFYACCIANALLNMGVPVLVTSLPRLVKRWNDKNREPPNLKAYSLIVIDDLGVENITQTVFTVIDEIYLNKSPLIVTTNLTPAQIKSPDTADKRRIYDRIREMCGGAPIKVDGESKRRQAVEEKRKFVSEILGL